MPRIQFPDVPNASGVPQVLRQLPAGPPAILGTAAGVAQLLRSFMSQPVWGVFKPVDDTTTQKQTSDGLEEVVVTAKKKQTPVVVPDSILDFGYQKEWTITSAQTQKGGFSDYNRVATPFEARVRMSKGGSEKDRTTFLKQIETLDSIQLYDIVTPEKVYLNCNFSRIELSREGERGAYFLQNVDLYFREIRVVTSQYSKTQIAKPIPVSAANVQNNGTQQGQTTTTAVPQTVTR